MTYIRTNRRKKAEACIKERAHLFACASSFSDFQSMCKAAKLPHHIRLFDIFWWAYLKKDMTKKAFIASVLVVDIVFALPVFVGIQGGFYYLLRCLIGLEPMLSHVLIWTLGIIIAIPAFLAAGAKFEELMFGSLPKVIDAIDDAEKKCNQKGKTT